MKTYSVLFLIVTNLPAAHGLFCWLFGFIGSRSAGAIGDLLNANAANAPSDTGLTPYDKFRIDSFSAPNFNGCTVDISVDFTFYNSGSPNTIKEEGNASVVGTLISSELLFALRVCVAGLEVTELNFDNTIASQFEDYARNYINDEFDDPECF